MGTLKSSGSFRPFGDLKSLLKKSALQKDAAPLSSSRPPAKIQANRSPAASESPESDDALFQKEMANVTPLADNNRVERMVSIPTMPLSFEDSERSVLLELKRLVDNGEGFVVSQTPEYMEGAGINVHPEIIQRLHRGDFSIQAHIDLHGLTVSEAKEAFNRFISEAAKREHRAVLIIHGRGLSSPDKPILKESVYLWLTAGPWRRRVLAFCSARLVDGGAGATYVLLRKHPTRKKQC